jgi:hypothetical protein
MVSFQKLGKEASKTQVEEVVLHKDKDNSSVMGGRKGRIVQVYRLVTRSLFPMEN